MSADRHLGDALHDLLDGRVHWAARAEAEAHVASCAECARELEALRRVKEAVRRAAVPAVPADLDARLTAALARETGVGPVRSTRRWLSPRAALALAAVLAVAFTATVLSWRSRSAPGVSAEIARAYSEYRDQRLPLELRTADTAALERYFASHGVPFPTHVYDLGMMGFQLVGGRVHLLDARDSALFVYHGANGIALLCDMYPGLLADLPPPVETREHDGIRFDVHQKDGLTMVFWEEGEIICVLVSEMPREDIVALAFAKAVKPSRIGS
jgi:anti-sigma factor RsiW